ncbi:hypothetical protein CWI73_03925 [Idiomarina piscisalsi]|uniref:Uncharacterized protein n=2 Tax=Idiomarina piscisalsi TaxID=1096243 RepID=A0A432YXH4_9GAMM|nr:hypothetical protein CWI73_03925 [Idiomarina piscisalsi]
MYLLTNNYSQNIGLYTISLAHIADDMKIEVDEARKLLNKLIEVNFCEFDKKANVIWVKPALEMSYGPSLHAKSNAAASALRQFQNVADSVLKARFYKANKHSYHLVNQDAKKSAEALERKLADKPVEDEITATEVATLFKRLKGSGARLGKRIKAEITDALDMYAFTCQQVERVVQNSESLSDVADGLSAIADKYSDVESKSVGVEVKKEDRPDITKTASKMDEKPVVKKSEKSGRAENYRSKVASLRDLI